MPECQFFMVWCETSHPELDYRHGTYQSAAAECKRLAREHGGKFHVMAHVATAERNNVTFTEAETIPF